MDILQRIDEALDKNRLMRAIRWEDLMASFFVTYDFFMNGNKDDKNIRNGQKVTMKAMLILGEFFDTIQMIDKIRKDYENKTKNW